MASRANEFYGVGRDAFKAKWTTDGNREEALKAPKECPAVLAKMSHAERVKRRLDNLYESK